MTLRTTFAEADSAIKKGDSDRAIKKVIFFGASIMFQSFASNAYQARARMNLARYGIDAEIVPAGVSGDGVVEWLARIDSVIATHAGESGVVFFLHGPGNDVSLTRPFSSAATDAEKKTIVDGLRTIIKKVQAAGFTFIMSNISRRYYDGSVGFDESAGSKPYNESLIEPVIRELVPHCWNSITSEPHINMYRIFGDDFSMFDVDGIHPNEAGELHINDTICAKIGEMFGRLAPRFNPPSGTRVVIGMGRSTAYTNPSINQSNISNRSLKANSIWGLGGPIYYNDANASNPTGRGNAGDASASWLNDEVQQASWFTELPPFPNNGVEVITHVIGNIEPYSAGTMIVSGSRNTTAIDRITEITYNGESKTFDASLPVQNVSFDFVADENGEIVFTQTQAAGSTFSYVSVVQLDW